jgi:hypothetical protein
MLRSAFLLRLTHLFSKRVISIEIFCLLQKTNHPNES